MNLTYDLCVSANARLCWCLRTYVRTWLYHDSNISLLQRGRILKTSFWNYWCQILRWWNRV